MRSEARSCRRLKKSITIVSCCEYFLQMRTQKVQATEVYSRPNKKDGKFKASSCFIPVEEASDDFYCLSCG